MFYTNNDIIMWYFWGEQNNSNADFIDDNKEDIKQNKGAAGNKTPEPQNNNNREFCYWCNCKTQEYVGLFEKGNICPKCKR